MDKGKVISTNSGRRNAFDIANITATKIAILKFCSITP